MVIDMIYEEIINIIPSKTLRDEIKNSNYKIDDLDLVYLVENYSFDILDKISYFKKLMDIVNSNEAKEKIEKLLNNIEKVKKETGDNLEIFNEIYAKHYDSIWEETDYQCFDDIKISLVTKEYKPNWPIYLNKFDLIKVKPYFDKENYHYAMINNFQEEFKGPTATVFLFEDVKESDLYAKEEYNGESYYVIPYNFAHDHIPIECIEKVEVKEAPEDIRKLYLKIMTVLEDRVNVSKYFYSPEIRDRLVDHKFSDIEKASIIDMSFYSIDDKINDLYELMNNTTNYSLYKQLKSYVKVLKELIPNLRKHKEDEFYEFMDCYQGKYYFKTYEEAYEKGVEISKLQKQYFQISKKSFGERNHSVIFCFDYQGKLVWTNEDKKIDCNIDEELFYNTYINLPSIFEKDGFRVAKRYLPVPEFGDGEFVILCSDQKEQYNCQKQLINKGVYLDITDSGPYIYIISVDTDVWEEPWGVFVNMYFVPENEMTLSMFQDIEFLKRGVKDET